MSNKNRYSVYDINWGMGVNDILVDADSPKNALKILGYEPKRDYENKGNIIVRGKNGTYIYFSNKNIFYNELDAEKIYGIK